VPVHIFATRALLEAIAGDKSLEQAVNATTLPGLVGRVLVMPDMHQGYGFPIGGVAATEYPKGVISPGAIGYDINCGVRLLGSRIEVDEVAGQLDELAAALDRHCPSGVGKSGHHHLSHKELEQVLRNGAQWALKKGFASEADLNRTEEFGRMPGAEPGYASERARTRGLDQLGTLGAGNHFIEVDVVDEVFDEGAAQVMGLQVGRLTLMIHCGSRGFGHQVCTDYVSSFQSAAQRYGIVLPDRELVCAPMDSAEGKAYMGAMHAAANFAFANRQLLAYHARQAFEDSLGGRVKHWQLHQIYDIAHNMGKVETHKVNGKDLEVCVHRKGATRAFGPGAPGLPLEYQKIGQPVLVPGSMGTASWVLVGTEGSMQRSFGSTCHGAGRTMSRSQARKTVRGQELIRDLAAKGIHVQAGSLSGLAEEAPQAYKDVDAVVETVDRAGIAHKVARLRPVVVVKG
jgi:tRNA-splicing ligase RtcB